MEMFMFNVDLKSNTPLYQQLYENIKIGIINNTISNGEKLPSKRELSRYLSISQTTIEHAYQLLTDEGYITSKPRSGFYVNDIVELPAAYHHENKNFTLKKESTNYKYSFKLGAIDNNHFPFELFRKYSKEAFDEFNSSLLESGHKQGDLNLRHEISQYLFHSRGVQCTPQQILIGSSTEQLLSIITDLLPKSEFMIEDPIYTQVRSLLKRKQVPFHNIPVGNNGINLEKVISLDKDIIYITPSHQFPTGVIMDLKRRTQLIKWASQKKTRYIIEDDYDSEFRYGGRPIPALQSLDKTESVIYISTFSKSISPTVRIAYTVLPHKLIDAYRQKSNIEGGTVPRHMQFIIARFMNESKFERHLNKMRKIYHLKRDLIIKQIKQYPELFSISGEKTGMHFIITILNGFNEEECIQRFKESAIEIKPLSAYRFKYNKDRLPQFVLGFGGIEESKINEHIAALINSLKKGSETEI